MGNLKKCILIFICLVTLYPAYALNKAGFKDVFPLIYNDYKAMKTDKLNLSDQQNNPSTKKESMNRMVESIHWYGQSSIRIPLKDKFIYIDPFQLNEKGEAAFVLITHPHFDHFNIDEIKKVADYNTPIYGPKECCDKLKLQGYKHCTDVVPGQSFTVEGIKIETVPSYNTVKTNHPKEKQWVGYLLTIGDLKIYHPGDTNRIPEMKSIRCDIAFMPLGQTYTMQNVQEAADAIQDVKAKIAIPFHYGMYEGAEDNALLFKQLLLNKATVVIKVPLTKLQSIQ